MVKKRVESFCSILYTVRCVAIGLVCFLVFWMIYCDHEYDYYCYFHGESDEVREQLGNDLRFLLIAAVVMFIFFIIVLYIEKITAMQYNRICDLERELSELEE